MNYKHSGLALLIVVGVFQHGMQCQVVQATSIFAATTQAICDIPGFTFKPNQVPSATIPQDFKFNNPVQLISLPYTPFSLEQRGPQPFHNLSATLAACKADPSCGMFTSNGYIIGAYRTSTQQNVHDKASTEADIIMWLPMDYCTWACCGTWVVDGLVEQLLQPVVRSGVLTINTTISDLPLDTHTTYKLNPDMLRTVCVGKPLTPMGGISQPGGPNCPARCLVACCKQLADTHRVRYDYMGVYHFSQCSGTVCQACGYAGNGVAAASLDQVLMRLYVRETMVRTGQAPARVQQGKKSTCIRGTSTAKNSGSQLC